jgi:YbbR domain-containing protein
MLLFLRDALFKDIWLKLFSLSLAVLIWFTVSYAIPTLPMHLVERTFNLPVVVMSSAADVRNLKVNPAEVEVTVQGDSKTLSKLQTREIRVLVDLTDITPVGDVHKRIEVSTPPGVSHVRVQPEDVQIIFPPKS